MQTTRPSSGQIAGLLAGGLLLIPFVAGAATEYLLVDDLPFIGKTTNIASYLQGLFKLGLGLAVLGTVFMLVVNGTRYMVSDITNEKAKARLGMKDAIVGLLIIFLSVLGLNTINPQLTQFNIVDTIRRTVKAIEAGQAAGPRPPATGEPWSSDANERSRLEAAGISFNNPNCTNVGQTGCTSVAGLSNSAIEALINLKQRCVQAQSGCQITITGGTEHWLHETHNNNNTVDLSADSGLNAYLGGAGNTCGVTREREGHNYRWEDSSCSWSVSGPHWHVRF
ncbi:MAG TPA: pilin [Candidatus Paceibacterota bacterium]|nr:pilin [Candidatus Paceibacterota bacterium]